jgi:hypothetical protein
MRENMKPGDCCQYVSYKAEGLGDVRKRRKKAES